LTQKANEKREQRERDRPPSDETADDVAATDDQ
jgi:hypothetical protein